jgi:hypothetical protein
VTGGWLAPVVSTATAQGPGQLAVADAGAVAHQGLEPMAGCAGAAELIAGDLGLVSGRRLEPTYDAGIDCDGWHMATSVKKERSRRTSWLSPMWRDIDSLRKQNESTKKEIESLRSETEILKRQNKALELIESSDLNVLLREATIPGRNDSKHPDDHLNLELLEEKLVAFSCDVDDIPFLLMCLN